MAPLCEVYCRPAQMTQALKPDEGAARCSSQSVQAEAPGRSQNLPGAHSWQSRCPCMSWYRPERGGQKPEVAVTNLVRRDRTLSCQLTTDTFQFHIQCRRSNSCSVRIGRPDNGHRRGWPSLPQSGQAHRAGTRSVESDPGKMNEGMARECPALVGYRRSREDTLDRTAGRSDLYES